MSEEFDGLLDQSDGKKSDWNEQQYFARLFFFYTDKCRLSQSQRDLDAWQIYLETKMSVALGVMEPDDQKKIMEIKETLNGLNRKRLIVKDPNKRSLLSSEFANALFCAESDIDQMVNTKMPFLNVKKKFDLDNF